jgi:toxin ParE1/3/4
VKTIGFFPAAQVEFDDALAASPYPTKFRRAVEKSLREIAIGIVTHARVPRTLCKRCILKKLPYSIIYTETEDEIRVIAFPHHKRRPGYWKQRLRPN